MSCFPQGERVSSDSLGGSSRGHQCGHGDSSQIAGQGEARPISGRGCSARAHAGHYAPDADPEGHNESSQQAHNGTLPRDMALSCHKASPTKALYQFPALLVRALPSHSAGAPPHMTLEPRGSLTGGFAQGKNIPRQKSPSSGPPTIPKMLMAACRGQGEKKKRTHRLRDPSIINVAEPHHCLRAPPVRSVSLFSLEPLERRILEGRNSYGNMPGVLQRLILRPL